MDEVFDKYGLHVWIILAFVLYFPLSWAYEEHLIQTGQLERQTTTSAGGNYSGFSYGGDWSQ